MTYLNPGIVSAESILCDTIHWDSSCVFRSVAHFFLLLINLCYWQFFAQSYTIFTHHTTQICMYIHLASYPPNHLCIYLATDFSLYLDTNLQSPACIWIEDEDSTETLSSNLQPSQSAGGLTIRRRNPVESSIWRWKGFHPSTHSIPSVRPSYPSTRIVHPSILSVHLHIYLPSYLFTYLPIYLYIYQSIYLSIHPSNCILSYNVAILGYM